MEVVPKVDEPGIVDMQFPEIQRDSVLMLLHKSDDVPRSYAFVTKGYMFSW